MSEENKSPADRDSDELMDSLAYLLIRVGRRLDLMLARIAHEYRLAIIDLKILLLLNRSDCNTLADLIRETSLDRGQASRSVRAMAGKKLLRVVVDANDARRKNLLLTGEGRALAGEVLAKRRQLEAWVIRSIPAGSYGDFKAHMEMILERLDDL